ncbi:MAG: hypothetical protein ABIO70_05410 [Pseudomonadota bacterium]
MQRLSSIALLLALPCPALAAAWGNPVANPAAARVSVAAEAGADQVAMGAEGCAGEACTAIWRPLTVGGRVEVAILRGVGLAGGGAWLGDRLVEAGYEGAGFEAWGGLDLALPVQPALFLALSSRLTKGRSGAPDGGGAWTGLALAGLLAWAPDDHSFALYGGLSAAPWQARALELSSPDLSLSLAPRLPVGGVLGAELRSDPLGLPWAGSRTAVAFGVEARAESGLGGGLWLAVEF